MLEKRIAIPFLGKELSAWLYRTTNWISTNPKKAWGLLALTCGAIVYVEANVVHRDELISPTVNNHLVYHVKKVRAEDVSTGTSSAAAVDHNVDRVRRAQLHTNSETPASASPFTTATTSTTVLTDENSESKRKAVEAILEREAEKDKRVSGTAMVVKSGQLYAREPHWNIRNSERNWSIMSRDQQQQKDHYWYRVDRSRDDDYARNTYAK